VNHFWPKLRDWLKAMPDARDPEAIVYSPQFLLVWGLCLFLFKLGSRRQLDYRLVGAPLLANLNRLAGAAQTTTPVHGTLDHFVGHLGVEALLALRLRMNRRLIRMKALDAGRLFGKFVVAADGTGWLVFRKRHCDHCLEWKQGGRTVYMHWVLEAKLVTPNGLALSLGTEFIENRDLPQNRRLSKKHKQDCELKAMLRLLPQLRAAYPQTPFCLTSDSLSACGPVIQGCKDVRFSFVLVFKEGRTPALWAEFQRLLPLCPENVLRVVLPDGAVQVFRWVCDLEHEDSKHRRHRLHAILCEETRNGETTTYAWITDLRASRDTVVPIASQGGRIRSKIENEGFNLQKNSDLNLEHPCSRNLERAKAYYFLLQIAHTILQLVEKGSLLRGLAAQAPRRAAPGPKESASRLAARVFGGLKNIAWEMLESFRRTLLPDEVFDPAAAARIQIRLNNSS